MCSHNVEKAKIYYTKTSQDDIVSNWFQLLFSPSFLFFLFLRGDRSSKGFLEKQGVVCPACIYRTVLAQSHALHFINEI